MTKAKPLSTANTPNDLEQFTDTPHIGSTTGMSLEAIAEMNAMLSGEGAKDSVNLDIADAVTIAAASFEEGTIPEDQSELAKFAPSSIVFTDERDTPATNPYLLESSTVLGDFHSEAQRAQLLINQLDHEIEHLTHDADYQIQRIIIRRDAELSQRERRKADLMKIVEAASMIGGKDETNA